MAGIMVTYSCANYNYLLISVGLSLFFLSALITLNTTYKQLKIYNYKGFIGLLFYVFLFIFGGLICLLHKQSLKKDYYANQSFEYLKGYINNEPQLSNHILRAELAVTTGFKHNVPQKVSGKLLIALKLDSIHPIDLKYGDELLIAAKYLPVEPPYNPAEFDFKSWLASKNIYHQAFINQDHLIKLNATKGNPILKYAIRLRQEQVKTYSRLIKDKEALAVASTLVLGYRADLSQETLSIYSKTGTIHALSVSGMHVGIIYIFLNWALFFLDRNRLLKIGKLLLISFLIWYYALLTGFSPSVLRSAIMLTVYIVAKAFHRNSNNYNILAFTAFCLLVYDPFLILDVGFQLSFLAVFGLIYLQPKIYKWIYVRDKWLDKLWSTVALSLAAQIATFPLSIYYFHQFPIYFIFSNLFILLPLTAMMYLGIVLLVLRLYFIAPLFEWIIIFTNNGLKWIANLPFSGITSIWLSRWQLILLCMVLTLFIFALANFKKKLLMASISGLLIFQSLTAYHKLVAKHQRKILFFSLRKEYAAAFIDGNEAVLLSNLTLTDKNFTFFIKPALDQMQIAKLHLINWEQDTILPSFIKRNHQINFQQYRILLIDNSFNYKQIANFPAFESIWLHQNPKVKIKDLRSTVLFSTLLIDATNRDYAIDKYATEANKFKLLTQILKKNNSYLIDLNRMNPNE